MSQSSGAYGEADATEQKNEQHNNQRNLGKHRRNLNARAKSPKSKGPNKWIIAIIAVIAVAAIIVGVVVFRNNNASSDTAENGTSNTVTIGLKLAPVSLDIRHQSGSAIEQVLIGNVYEGLLSRDSDNKVQPGLAKSWDISNDGTTYTFHLNENMNFSNGDTLDAEDVAWSINQLKEQQYYNANQSKASKKPKRSIATP